MELETFTQDFEFSNVLNALDELLEDCKIKKFYRKYRGVHRKTKRRYMFFYNPIHDLILSNLSITTKLLNKRLRKE